MSKDPPDLEPSARKPRPYRAPRLEHLGHVGEVTRKTGTPPDTNQFAKPGAGMG